MIKPFLILTVLSLIILVNTFCIAHANGKDATIECTKSAKHIRKITENSIVVNNGKTNYFTVDTPEDGGLVSTLPTVNELIAELLSVKGLKYQIIDKGNSAKTDGVVLESDLLTVSIANNKVVKKYAIKYEDGALGGKLELAKPTITVNSKSDLTINFTAGQRSANTAVKIFIPKQVKVTDNNTSINIIGRGAVKLKNLPTQSIGRVGANYPIKKVGDYNISTQPDGSTLLTLTELDLRPANGADVELTFSDVTFEKTGDYIFKAIYTTTEPEILTSAGTGNEIVKLSVTQKISDFERVVVNNLDYHDFEKSLNKVDFKWNSKIEEASLLQSLDKGKTWQKANAKFDFKAKKASVLNLISNKLYQFKLDAKRGAHKGFSNIATYYSGKMDAKSFGVKGDDKTDDTENINRAIAYLHKIGGGTLFFSDGDYNVKTIHLKSNVYLYLTKGATIKALKGQDVPEPTWFSDKKYRTGISPIDTGPYQNPQNWLTKQDLGHTFFQNAMFVAERFTNIKIIGNGRITGNGNLVTGDGLVDQKGDKMFSLKLCTNVEIGGIYRKEDLWYDEIKKEPYYISSTVEQSSTTDNMLNIDGSGHFALLATGTDGIKVHDTYFGRLSVSNMRDIYDFMQCNTVKVTNIYSKNSSDDIVKPGSDCSLGFTRPVKNYMVRNIIGSTHCNLFQIGSETADDITDICVDNIYVLGANKAGFSISTNDGATVKNIHLNCGETGLLRQSKMMKTTTPFFISISNRARILGAEVGKYEFMENGIKRNELLAKNVNIGVIENIAINGVDVTDVYAGHPYKKPKDVPITYNETQAKATPIIAGFALPNNQDVTGGLDFKLPNGEHTGYIKNITFINVNISVKGGNPASDRDVNPPELGVGKYNVPDFKTQPSYGIWARHVSGLKIDSCSFAYEKLDNRYAIYLDDVKNSIISNSKITISQKADAVFGFSNSKDINFKNLNFYYPQENFKLIPVPSVSNVIGSGMFNLNGLEQK